MKELQVKDIEIGKRGKKLFLFAYNIIFYIENSKKSILKNPIRTISL